MGYFLSVNYAIEKSPSHHLYAVERGLRVLENPDGSGEQFLVKTPRRPGKGYGEYTTITAIAGELTVAD